MLLLAFPCAGLVGSADAFEAIGTKYTESRGKFKNLY